MDLVLAGRAVTSSGRGPRSPGGPPRAGRPLVVSTQKIRASAKPFISLPPFFFSPVDRTGFTSMGRVPPAGVARSGTARGPGAPGRTTPETYDKPAAREVDPARRSMAVPVFPARSRSRTAVIRPLRAGRRDRPRVGGLRWVYFVSRERGSSFLTAGPSSVFARERWPRLLFVGRPAPLEPKLRRFGPGGPKNGGPASRIVNGKSPMTAPSPLPLRQSHRDDVLCAPSPDAFPNFGRSQFRADDRRGVFRDRRVALVHAALQKAGRYFPFFSYQGFRASSSAKSSDNRRDGSGHWRKLTAGPDAADEELSERAPGAVRERVSIGASTVCPASSSFLGAARVPHDA